MVGRGELLEVEVGGAQVVDQRGPAPGGGAKLGRAGGRHAREPVQALSVQGREPGHAHRSQHPPREQRPAGQGVVTPTGVTHDREQRLGRRAEVGRPVVPQHRQPAVLPGGVVHVDGAPVGQLHIGLGHHPSSLVAAALAVTAGVWNGVAPSDPGGDVTQQPAFQLTATVLDAPDPRKLADFYSRLLGWPIGRDEPDWATVRPPGGGAGLSFQLESAYVRPTWPAGPGDQQMQMHLDIEVDDLEAAAAHAAATGAVLADFQPQEDVRVFLDPAGHPFCLWVSSAS
jgi:catechol 2,3-dioxygenase-like lactoylglutathione lyase family enzyme